MCYGTMNMTVPLVYMIECCRARSGLKNAFKKDQYETVDLLKTKEENSKGFDSVNNSKTSFNPYNQV